MLPRFPARSNCLKVMATRMVNRLVLDACLLRRGTAAFYERLASKGFCISVSIAGITEIWADAHRRGKPGLLLGPVRRLDPFVDPDHPIAMTGAKLVAILGGKVTGVAKLDAERYIDFSRRVWKLLVSTDRTEELMSLSGNRAVFDVDGLREDWRGVLDESPPEIQAMSSEERAMKPDEIRNLARQFAERELAQAGLPGDGYEWFNAHYHVKARLHLHAGRDVQFRSSERRGNDAQDIASLMHVGEPAFFATADYRLLDFVDKSCSFQAPWIRSGGEVVAEPLPECLPWGEGARQVSRDWSRKARADLDRLDRTALKP